MTVTRYLTLSFLLISSLQAQAKAPMEQLQIPQCLAAKITQSYPILAESKDFKILNVPSADIDSLVLLADQVGCGRFINVSPGLALLEQAAPKSEPGMYTISHEEDIVPALKDLKKENIISTLTHLTSFYNRSASTDYGLGAAHWLEGSFRAMVESSGRKDVDIYFVATGNYIQPSLVTLIGKDRTGPAVVLGAHMDTLNGRMPGAGDDGSGSASLMEVARILLHSSLEFKQPIYIIWYAAEERGLVGSRYVVEDFLQKAIPVKAVLQFDMTGYRPDPADPSIWVYRDNTDNNLSDYLMQLIETYVGVPVGESRCGYGCSDHASWNRAGFPAAFPCEGSIKQINPKKHTPEDTMDRLTPEHMLNFAKLGVAFAMELAL